jgi:hypothetical protein
MTLRLLALLLLTLLLAPTSPATLPPLQDPGDWEEDRAAIEAEARDASRELRLAQAHLELLEVEQAAARMEAEFALEEAREALSSYRDFGADMERQESELDLMGMETQLAEAREEREQLALMYEANELADATVQIVLDRADRSIAEQDRALDLARRAHEHMQAVERPQVMRQLDRDLRRAEMELRVMELAQPVARMEQEFAIHSLEETLRELRRELAEGEHDDRDGEHDSGHEEGR